MVKEQQKILTLTKWVSSLTLVLGFMMFLSHFILSVSSSEYVLMSGIGVMTAAVFLFISGSFLSSLEGYREQTQHLQ